MTYSSPFPLPAKRGEGDRRSGEGILARANFTLHGNTMNQTKITVETIRAMKSRGEKIAALTAYDFPMARLLDEAGIPIIFVGDSLGMVVLGYSDTTRVTMVEMEHHVRAAARAKPNALLGADLPFKSYETPEQAVENSKRLVAAGAEFVKAEGGREIVRPSPRGVRVSQQEPRQQ